MNTGWKLWAVVLFFSVSAFAQDFLCTTSNKRYMQPGACQNECRPTKEGNGLTRAVTGADRPCSFRPVCVGIMKHLSGTGDTLQMAYNAAAFQKNPMPRPREVIIANVLWRFYPGYNIKQFDLVIGDVNGRDQWASLMPASAPGAKPSLTVSPDLFYLTPAYLITVIGHELVHDQQYKRKNPVNPNGFRAVVDSIRELEATHWEMGIDTFNRGFRSETYLCTDEGEKQEARMTHACRDWQVTKAIYDIRTGPRKTQLMPKIEQWLMADAWAKDVYIPEHPDWKTAKPGPAPDEVCTAP